MSLSMDKLARFVQIELERRTKEAEVEALKDERALLVAELMPQFEQAGISTMRVGGLTVYIKTQLWAGAADGDKDATVQALKAAGMGDLVSESFNTQTLSAWARELRKEISGNDPVPASLEDLQAAMPEPLRTTVKLTDKHDLATRRS